MRGSGTHVFVDFGIGLFGRVPMPRAPTEGEGEPTRVFPDVEFVIVMSEEVTGIPS